MYYHGKNTCSYYQAQPDYYCMVCWCSFTSPRCLPWRPIRRTIIACKWLLINCYVYVNVYTFVNLMHQTGNACVYCESVCEKVNKNEIKITQSHFILFLLIFFFFFYLHVCVNNWFYLSSFIFWLHAFWYRSFESTPNAGLFLSFFFSFFNEQYQGGGKKSYSRF